MKILDRRDQKRGVKIKCETITKFLTSGISEMPEILTEELQYTLTLIAAAEVLTLRMPGDSNANKSLSRHNPVAAETRKIHYGEIGSEVH